MFIVIKTKNRISSAHDRTDNLKDAIKQSLQLQQEGYSGCVKKAGKSEPVFRFHQQELSL